MSDKINEIRFALRSLLSEDIHEQAIIAIEVMPGGDEDKAEWQSFVRVTGFDASSSRGSKGYGGGSPGVGPSHGDTPNLTPTAKEVGAWQVLGVPDRTATGMSGPSPWIAFMDWFWDFLKSANLNPAPAKGFGLEQLCAKKECPERMKGRPCRQYGHLSPAQKRNRKYGTQFRSSEDPEFLSDKPLKDVIRTRALSTRVKSIGKKKEQDSLDLWPTGFHIDKEVSIVTSPMGVDQDMVIHKFREIMSKAKAEQWFRIAWDTSWDVFFVYVNIDSEMPEGWRSRLASLQIYHAKRKAEWGDLLRDLSQYRTNVAQLRPIIARFMVDKHGFEAPFNIDVLDDEEYARAKDVIQKTKLDDLVAYAKSINVVPPSVGAPRRTTKVASMDKMWDDIIQRLADQGAVDVLVADVALSNMLASMGFGDPFDFELMAPDKKLKALNIARRLTFNDVRGMIESVKAQIGTILG